MLETYLQKAKDIVEILQYYHTHPGKLDNENSLIVSYPNDGMSICLLQLYTLEQDYKCDIDLNAKYINYIPGFVVHYYNNISDISHNSIEKYQLQPTDYLDSCTEEGYFQKSTVYTEEDLEAVVLQDYISKFIDFSFYIDLEQLVALKHKMKMR